MFLSYPLYIVSDSEPATVYIAVSNLGSKSLRGLLRNRNSLTVLDNYSDLFDIELVVLARLQDPTEKENNQNSVCFETHELQQR